MILDSEGLLTAKNDFPTSPRTLQNFTFSQINFGEKFDSKYFLSLRGFPSLENSQRHQRSPLHSEVKKTPETRTL